MANSAWIDWDETVAASVVDAQLSLEEIETMLLDTKTRVEDKGQASTEFGETMAQAQGTIRDDIELLVTFLTYQSGRIYITQVQQLDEQR